LPSPRRGEGGALPRESWGGRVRGGSYPTDFGSIIPYPKPYLKCYILIYP